MTLRVTTVFQDLPLTAGPGSMVFSHGESSLIGEGVALRIAAKGQGRIQELSDAWKEICLKAQIDDQVKLPGSGLVAFTSITFSKTSGFESVLMVPRTLSVTRDGIHFVTTIDQGDNLDEALVLPEGQFISGAQSPKGFLEATEKAIEKINNSALEKVVLSRDLVMPLSNMPDLSVAIQRLKVRYPNCWTYNIAGVFGASPELLLRSEKGEVSARVLAGTAGRGTDPDVDRAIAAGLRTSHKNQHEHGFAVESMLSELAPFCSDLEADAEPFSLALPDLWHLATDVRGKLQSGVSLLDVIAKLHPTAAVAGTPRALAEDLISELEPFDRGGYSGPIGWLAADGSGELAIALRGGLIESGTDGFQIRAFAGCGIVAESDPEAELAETELKFRAVRYAFES